MGGNDCSFLYGDLNITTSQIYKMERRIPRGRPHEYELAAARFLIDNDKKIVHKWADDGFRKRVLLHRQKLMAHAVVTREAFFRKRKEYRLRPLPLSSGKDYNQLDLQLLDGALHSLNFYDESDDFFELRDEMFIAINKADEEREKKEAEEAIRASKKDMHVDEKMDFNSDSEVDDIFNEILDTIVDWNIELKEKKRKNKEEKPAKIDENRSISHGGRRSTRQPSPLASSSCSFDNSPPMALQSPSVDINEQQNEHPTTGIDELTTPMNFQLQQYLSQPSAVLEQSQLAQQAVDTSLPNALIEQANSIYAHASHFLQEHQRMLHTHNNHIEQMHQRLLQLQLLQNQHTMPHVVHEQQVQQTQLMQHANVHLQPCHLYQYGYPPTRDQVQLQQNYQQEQEWAAYNRQLNEVRNTWKIQDNDNNFVNIDFRKQSNDNSNGVQY